MSHTTTGADLIKVLCWFQPIKLPPVSHNAAGGMSTRGLCVANCSGSGGVKPGPDLTDSDSDSGCCQQSVVGRREDSNTVTDSLLGTVTQ